VPYLFDRVRSLLVERSQGSNGPSFRLVGREHLLCTVGARTLSIGAYGRWKRGEIVQFIINDRWNLPANGAVLIPSELATVQSALRDYASRKAIIPAITVDRHAA
jgi:hypothetical protein